jgi:hypothetical protein
MKPLVVLVLLCTSLFGAEPLTNATPDILSKGRDILGRDGQPDMHIETVYRGKTKVLSVWSQRNKQGAMVVSARGYYAEGELAMVEEDTNGDGILDRVAVYDTRTGAVEMFERQPDGSVKPVSTKTLEATKKQIWAVNEAGRKLAQGNRPPTEEEIDGLLQEARRKIADAEKEKHGEK